MKIGDRIRTERAWRGWSREELSRRCGISKGYITQLENNQRLNPSGETLQQLAKAFEITVDALVQGPPLPTQVAELQAQGLADPLVAQLIAAWPTLTPEDREAIIAMTRAILARYPRYVAA